MSTNPSFSQNHAALYLQYSGTPTQGHEEYLQALTSPEPPGRRVAKPVINPNFRQPNNVHINPKFQKQQDTGGAKIAINPSFSSNPAVMHVNPRFKPSPPPSPKKEPTSIHINPRFANRPLPSVPPAALNHSSVLNHPPALNQQPALNHPTALNHPSALNNSSALKHPSAGPSSTANKPEPIYVNRPPSITAPPIPPEPLYANINPNPVNLDQRKTDDFVQSIAQSVQHSQVVMRNRFKKDNRAKPPDKPVRHSIIEKPNRYSTIIEKPKRNSVYVVQNTPNNFSVSTPAATAAIVAPSVAATATPAATVTPPSAFKTPARKNEGKENVPSSSSKKSFLFTPLRKTPFKKIGSRKLVRKKSSPGTPKPSFKRIGNNKLVRIRESLAGDKASPLKVYKIKTKTKIVKSVKNTPTNNSKYRFSFITPLSLRKSKLVSQTFGSARPKTQNSGGDKKPSFANRFRLDRRRDRKTAKPLARTSSSALPRKTTSTTRLRKLSGSTYRVSATKLQRVAAPAKPSRARQVSIYRPKAAVLNPSLAPNRLITVQGVKFAVAENGRKLKRLSESESTAANSYSASVSHTSPGQSQTTSPGLVHTSPAGSGTSPVVSAAATSPFKANTPVRPANANSTASDLNPKQVITKKTYIGGEEFDEVEPGVFTRSRHSLTRQSITQAKNRSINTILKVQNRSKQYCMFYNKFGKCTKKEKGSCPYIHDPEKIAVCRRFLQGACSKDKCLLSHKLALEKMPACKFFLEGVCTKENCPYLHVKVNDKAGVCQRFLKGFCPNGADCDQRHVIACPEFDRTGACSKQTKCPFPHIQRTTDKENTRPKRKPPVKPKRKSLGQNETALKKSRVTARYYDQPNIEDNAQEEKEENGETAASSMNLTSQDGTEECQEPDLLEEKRKRIMRKIEMAKKVWQAGLTQDEDQGATMEVTDTSLNDSGPYEKIAEDEGTQAAAAATPMQMRPPLPSLGDYISLNGDDDAQDRLI